MDAGTRARDTIAAVATPPGKGGIGVIRVSGPLSKTLAEKIVQKLPLPRHATFSRFKDDAGNVIDEGLVLYFPAPNSFTGEDVLEFQAHGGPIVLDLLLSRLVDLGARIAKPGEFSERAFLNDKLDLAQAEAIADLIDSTTRAAALSAVRSLQGEFSRLVLELVEQMIELRMFVEAAIDFPEEEIDFLSDEKVKFGLTNIKLGLDNILKQASDGALLRDGITLVLAGKPNSGKSSLMNQLSGRASSIVTDIPGTTRDLINEFISVLGLPLKLVDTAGLRVARDAVEAEGVKRALSEIELADGVLLVVDPIANPDWLAEAQAVLAQMPKTATAKVLVVLNKLDLRTRPLTTPVNLPFEVVQVSALTGENVDILKHCLKTLFAPGFSSEGTFIARARHVDAISRARSHVKAGEDELVARQAGELLAEELRCAQEAMSEITGEFSSDDLLGRIFSSFCIGK